MIPEATIENAITKLSESREEVETRFLENHRIFFDYLHNEILSALEDDLQAQLIFYITIIHESCFLANGSLPPFSLEDYAENEDNNWRTTEKNSNWEETVNFFFRDYPEEDLLAFVEDMLSEIDGSEKNTASTEVIFIVAKSYIDTVCSL